MAAVAAAILAAPCVPAPGVAEVSARTKVADVLILGDSVGSVLRWAGASMRPFWDGRYNVTLETWGCQALLRPGCLAGKPIPAIDVIAKHRNDGIDVVVVMTGYNDVGPETIRLAMRKISRASEEVGAHVIWLTYRENGNVKVKNRAFNKVVRAEDDHLDNLSVLDWEKISRHKRDWFSADSVHMTGAGGLQLARHIRKALNRHFGLST